MSAPGTYELWYKTGLAAAIPFLAGGPNGQAEAATWPRLIDDILKNQLTQARYQSFPDKCAPDALPHLGNDRKLIQGSNETNASFQTRLKDAWGQWSRAGTPCSVLEQLYYFGLSGAVWVQQNGLQYTLSGAPTPGADPTSLVVASNLDATTSPLTDSLTGRSIPVGTPWFAFDTRTDMTNRFAIIIPSWPFSAIGTAYFNNSDTAVVTWPFAFPNNTYGIVYGVPTAPVVISVDGSTATTTQVTIDASAPWTGSIPVIAWEPGVNPLNIFSVASLGALQRIISTFRPNAICMGVFAIQSGEMWDYPTGLTWDGDSNLWDASSVSQILGSF